MGGFKLAPSHGFASMRELPLVIAILLSGCVGQQAASAELGSPLPPPEDTLIVDHDITLLGVEYDALCQYGGGITLERVESSLIANGTVALDIQIEADPTYPGVQVGYSVDGGETVWLDPVIREGRFEVALDPGQWEVNEPRWTFWYQLNPPPAPQECYTGVGTLHRAIKITAIIE